MTIYTAFYLILALGAALGISYYQYFYKTKYKDKIFYYLALLRALTFFLIAALFINPKFNKNTYSIEKPNLVLAVDNSASIPFFKESKNVKQVVNAFKADAGISKKFDIQSFAFGDNLIQTDTFTFEAKQTKIESALKQLNSLYSKNSVLVLLSDGNQTQGADYSYYKTKFPIYTLVVGDTSRFNDIAISQINTNPYSYIGNNFPVEVFLKRDGNKAFTSTFKVSEKGKTVFSKKVSFKKNENSKTLNFSLKTKRTGVHQFKAMISPIENEKNLKNNQKYFSINTLSERSNILLVSSIAHPDIGAIKRSIESNKQRKLKVIIGRVKLTELAKFQLIILYQPTSLQNKLFEKIQKENLPYFIITGTKTDWNFLNKAQSLFHKNFINQTQDYLARLNLSYSPFVVKDIGFNKLPPLEDFFGSIAFKSTNNQTILYQQIGNKATKQPLLTTFKRNDKRGAALFGANIWKWRMASFSGQQNFIDFDNFLNNIIQYLVEIKANKQLKVDYKSVVYSNEPLTFLVNYLDTNRKFDARASLEINITNELTKEKISYPLALESNYYHINLSNLVAGNYTFVIKENNSGLSQKGKFTILNFPIEKQFYNANYNNLAFLANTNKGNTFLLKKYNDLKAQLLTNNDFKSIQTKKVVTSNLLSFYWLLLLIIASAVTEWFIRKTHGLI
ncbi:MAG: VWA domain-containing protein [Flavobacteriaceae bacterium]|nr:VWA domain-containing protein [Flavobacteriaceae bacterium]